MTAPEFSRPEFSRTVDVRQAEGKQMKLTADEAERAALARRFGLVRIDRLEADVLLRREGQGAEATGRLKADIVQSCAVSGEDLSARIDEPLALRFAPAREHRAEVDAELDSDDPDEIEFEGTEFDLGEAVSQSLSLAIDPFAVGPDAEEARRVAGLANEGASGPFAALAAMRKKN